MKKIEQELLLIWKIPIEDFPKGNRFLRRTRDEKCKRNSFKGKTQSDTNLTGIELWNWNRNYTFQKEQKSNETM